MLKWLELIKLNDEPLRQMGALESGIPIGRASVATAHAWIEYYAGWADKIGGATSDANAPGGLNFTRKEAYGVIGVIIPWNFPLVAIGMAVSPALAAGNAVVLKPPAATPFVALFLGELALQAGMPPGLLSVLPGDAEVGDAMVRHPGIGKISFTGGAEVARHVMQSAAATLKPLFLELGGKSPNIVCEDADLNVAVPMSLRTCMGLSGQGCVLPTRMLVHEAVYDDVVERVRAVSATLKVGAALDPDSHMGPVISDTACRRILGVIEGARERGDGRLAFGGKRLGGALANGYFIEPTVFADVDPGSPLAQEEVFGPVLAVMRYRSDEEAIAIANNSFFGLGAYVQTRDLGRALRMAEKLQAGYVSVNSHPTMTPTSPFGGYKQSGFGRLGGREGLEEYLQTKTVFMAYNRS
jgi:aldehyde dehydrogenase (NAD+)